MKAKIAPKIYHGKHGMHRKAPKVHYVSVDLPLTWSDRRLNDVFKGWRISVEERTGVKNPKVIAQHITVAGSEAMLPCFDEARANVKAKQHVTVDKAEANFKNLRLYFLPDTQRLVEKILISALDVLNTADHTSLDSAPLEGVLVGVSKGAAEAACALLTDLDFCTLDMWIKNTTEGKPVVTDGTEYIASDVLETYIRGLLAGLFSLRARVLMIERSERFIKQFPVSAAVIDAAAQRVVRAEAERSREQHKGVLLKIKKTKGVPPAKDKAKAVKAAPRKKPTKSA